ncbi:DsbC family protein [Luteimonas sp. e5]
MKKALLTALLGGMSLIACAQDKAASEAPASAAAPEARPQDPAAAPGSADANAIAAIRKLNQQVEIDRIEAAPLPGFRQVVISGQVVYVSDDGRYLMQGALYDVQEARDLSADALGGLRKELIDKVPASERIVYAPANPKYRVAVFTDVECPFCRAMHRDMAEYNRLGIAIEYLAFPRMGPASEDFRKMESIWCADNRKQVMDQAMAERKPKAATCTSPVMAHWNLGQRIGLQGTPLIVAENGLSPPGYVPPAQLLQWLEANVGAR